MKAAKKQTEILSLRLEPELRASIEAAADADRRPTTQLIRNILTDWLREHPSHTGATAS
jgi:hypothetical protein